MYYAWRMPNELQQYTNAELLEIFPEASTIIPALIKDYSKQRKELVKAIAKEHGNIMANPDEMFRYFWTSWLKLTKVQDLWVIDKDIDRLQRFMQPVVNEPKQSNRITDNQIEDARAIPIESLLNQEFRRSGSNLVGRCPFHDENTPSFYIYVQENRGWCFGCNNGGDTIDIVMRLHDLNFRDAVQYLVGGQR